MPKHEFIDGDFIPLVEFTDKTRNLLMEQLASLKGIEENIVTLVNQSANPNGNEAEILEAINANLIALVEKVDSFGSILINGLNNVSIKTSVAITLLGEIRDELRRMK